MPNTQGFETVAEVREEILRRILYAAWKSSSDLKNEDPETAQGVIPEHIEIEDNPAFGPYIVETGTILIPQDELDLNMNTDPAINGVDIKIGTIIDIEIQNPPIQSARLFKITADFTISTPIRAKEENRVYVILENLPANALQVNITSGDPVGEISQDAIEEYVHELFASGTFKKVYDDEIPQFPILGFTFETYVELYDVPGDPNKSVTVDPPVGNRILVKIPCYLRFYNIDGSFSFGGIEVELRTPMGIKGVIEVDAEYTEGQAGGIDFVEAKLDTANYTLTNIQPSDNAEEAANYNYNENLISFGGFYDLENLIVVQFDTLGVPLIRQQFVGKNPRVTIPTVAQIEDFMLEELRKELNRRKEIFVWKPQPPETDDANVAVEDVTPQALPDALAIGINQQGATNPAGLANFIPADRDFSVGISEDKVIEELIAKRNEQYPGLADGGSHTLDERVRGKRVRINSLNFSLINGAIRMSGNVTVIDAILGSINVSADFTARAGLRWIDNADGTQTLDPFQIGEPDIDQGILGWIFTFLLSFITLGIIGVIVSAVIFAVVKNMAESIGATVVEDEVSGNLVVLSAWPQTLDNIGDIQTRFLNDVIIEPSGIIFSGSMVVTSEYALTLIDQAASNGPYASANASSISFNGGTDKANTNIFWDFDDGNTSIIRRPSHIYGKSGLYVAKLRVEVTEEGGVATRSFARVEVANVNPVVSLPAELRVKEGEEFTIVGTFFDLNWLDTHTASIDFGDNSKPQELAVMETNEAPRAEGEVCGTHRYCDDGIYTVTLTIRDDVGGIGTAQMRVIVENVPPVLEVPEKVNSLVGQPITLEARFSDQGWCDTHKGFWDLGDCSKKRQLVIREENEEPEAKGQAYVTHFYENCGLYQSKIELVDDDGGKAEANMLVNVNRLENANFEAGFYAYFWEEKTLKIANQWLPYVGVRKIREFLGIQNETAIDIFYDAKEFVVYEGQRAQEIELVGPMMGGIWQQVEVNPGWEYEFTACYQLPFPYFRRESGFASTGESFSRSNRNSLQNASLFSSGRFDRVNMEEVSIIKKEDYFGPFAQIGIDPYGNEDPESDNIIWVTEPLSIFWRNISVKAQAKAERITLFIGMIGLNSWKKSIFWDHAKLIQLQPRHIPSIDTSVCIRFDSIGTGRISEGAFSVSGVEFQSVPDWMEILLTSEGSYVKALKFPYKGLSISWEEPTDFVSLVMNDDIEQRVIITLYSGSEQVDTFERVLFPELQKFSFQAESIDRILLLLPDFAGREDDRRAFLYEVCIGGRKESKEDFKKG